MSSNEQKAIWSVVAFIMAMLVVVVVGSGLVWVAAHIIESI